MDSTVSNSTLKQAITRYKKGIDERTLCFLLEDNKVLLGHKKTGFGKGKTVGIGGSLEQGETAIQAVVRECEEEIFVTPIEPKAVATIDYYFPYIENPESWNQRAYVYLATQWQGEPKESDEIKPQWFGFSEIPFDKMWDDAKFWLPRILKGETLKASFTFNLALEVDEFEISP